ncbi:uncharacterized protein LOC108109711 [Drosophila eugracilis]|uniref:uncharacterized protein LOC108109711 n=1 Tax=Drosophila eugracilis TaxID=29029 RepID=UPI0007E7AE0A|nr:uncharacterized protein LOC108109711 [Drosophila eugracilis]
MNNKCENNDLGSPVAEDASELVGSSSHGRISPGGSGGQTEDPKPDITESNGTNEDVPKTADPNTSKSEGVDPEAGKFTAQPRNENRARRRAHSEDLNYDPYPMRRACQDLPPEAFEQLLRHLENYLKKEEAAQEETDVNRGAEVDNKENAPPTEVEQREEDEVDEDPKTSD